MATQTDNSHINFTCDEALAVDTLVKLDSDGRVTTAGLAATPIGVATNPTAAAGDRVSVHGLNSQGLVRMKTGGPVAAGAAVYCRANGLIDDDSSSSAVKVGVAVEAASGAGSVIGVFPRNPV